ncbi:MAG: hypothetical protein V4489_06990 [Chlamydiota bacterium]
MSCIVKYCNNVGNSYNRTRKEMSDDNLLKRGQAVLQVNDFLFSSGACCVGSSIPLVFFSPSVAAGCGVCGGCVLAAAPIHLTLACLDHDNNSCVTKVDVTVVAILRALARYS